MLKKSILLIVVLFAILALAGYLYYPNIEEAPRSYLTPKTTVTATTMPMMQQLDKSEVPSRGSSIPSQYKDEIVIGTPGRDISVTVHLVLTVKDVKAAAARASSIATSLGGYVQSSSISNDRGYITLKVPRERLDEALSSLKSLGKLEREELSTIDLTNSIIDIDARLRNAEAEEERLLNLLNKAVTINDILEIESRLSAVREKIERLEAMKKEMERRVDYSTIQLELNREGVKPQQEDIISRIERDAYRALMGSIYIIVVGGAFLFIPAVMAIAVYLLVRSRRKSEP